MLLQFSVAVIGIVYTWHTLPSEIGTQKRKKLQRIVVLWVGCLTLVLAFQAFRFLSPEFLSHSRVSGVVSASRALQINNMLTDIAATLKAKVSEQGQGLCNAGSGASFNVSDEIKLAVRNALRGKESFPGLVGQPVPSMKIPVVGVPIRAFGTDLADWWEDQETAAQIMQRIGAKGEEALLSSNQVLGEFIQRYCQGDEGSRKQFLNEFDRHHRLFSLPTTRIEEEINKIDDEIVLIYKNKI